MNRKETQINIFGINTNNLKNIDVSIPLEGITLIVGPSGSGKSSLAYDTLAQIGIYEYMSMFGDDVEEPSYKVDRYENMISTVPIRQMNHNHNMRSTIGTYFGFNDKIARLYSSILGLDAKL